MVEIAVGVYGAGIDFKDHPGRVGRAKALPYPPGVARVLWIPLCIRPRQENNSILEHAGLGQVLDFLGANNWATPSACAPRGKVREVFVVSERVSYRRRRDVTLDGCIIIVVDRL